MSSYEAWAARVARRFTIRDDEASVSLARSLVRAARLVDAGKFEARRLMYLAHDVRACERGSSLFDLKARRWARIVASADPDGGDET